MAEHTAPQLPQQPGRPATVPARRAPRASKSRHPSIHIAPKVVEFPRQEETAFEMILRMREDLITVQKLYLESLARTLAQYRAGRLNAGGHQIEIMQRSTDRGMMDVIIVDGMVQGEVPA